MLIRNSLPCIALAFSAGTPELMAQCPATAVDIDGNSYNVAQYGNQCWMTSNLRTTKYRNGHSITNVTSNTAWETTAVGAWAYYMNNSSYNTVHGKLYNWYAVNDPRGLCPSGWRIPSDLEWQELELHLGVPSSQIDWFGVRGNAQNVGGRMKVDNGTWFDPNENATNQSGFSATPAGTRTPDGVFSGLTNRTHFWSSTSYVDIDVLAFLRDLDHYWGGISRAQEARGWGVSCRCMRGLSLVGIEDENDVRVQLRVLRDVEAQVLIVQWNGGPATLRLSDMSGRLIAEGRISASPHSLPTAGLPAGVYILSLRDSESTASAKVIIE